MMLNNASVQSLDDGMLTLRFPRPGDVKGFASSGYEELLKEVLASRFGMHFMVKAMAGDAPQAGAGGTAQPGTGTGSAGNTARPARPGPATTADAESPSSPGDSARATGPGGAATDSAGQAAGGNAAGARPDASAAYPRVAEPAPEAPPVPDGPTPVGDMDEPDADDYEPADDAAIAVTSIDIIQRELGGEIIS